MCVCFLVNKERTCVETETRHCINLTYIIPTDIPYCYRVEVLLKFPSTNFVLYVVIPFSARLLKLIMF